MSEEPLPKPSDINPFAEALQRARGRRRGGAGRTDRVLVALDAEDVRQVRPDWSTGKAQAFLHQYAETIAAVMLKAGQAAVRKLAAAE